MSQLFLNRLAKEVLYYLDKPISKVKFAKVIYFVFKGLLIEKCVNSRDLAFIRMPLGPVPDGFMELECDSEIEVSEEHLGLVYNRKNYSLTSKVGFLLSSYTDRIQYFSEGLNKFATSSLVEKSHDEPSWIALDNGSKYYLHFEDLALQLPKFKQEINLTEEIDDQLIQSRLLSGMKKEVIQDNTSLEYPEYYH